MRTMKLTKEFGIIRLQDDTSCPTMDRVITECALELTVNGSLMGVLLCTPQDLEALVYGHLLAEGLIKAKCDVLELSLDGSCAEVRANSRQAQKVYGPCLAEVCLDAQELFAAMETFQSQSSLFQATGGVHSAALCQSATEKIFMEDIGRHNAVDKVLGKALFEDWDISRTFLITTGRVSVQLITKALHTGLTIIISRSAPTDQAVELARRHNLTLAGFARGRRVNIYSGPERLRTTD